MKTQEHLERWPVLLAVLVCMAPVPGDVGSCGQSPDELDARTFFRGKRQIDCIRCEECGIVSLACIEACDRSALPLTSFREGCRPVVHDGEVCLRKLLDASCDDYATYVRDEQPQVPTECNFCPLEEP